MMGFLHENAFDPILNSDRASKNFKQGVRLTIMRTVLYNLVLNVPRPGRYILAMQLNGDEFAQRTMYFAHATQSGKGS